MKPVRAFMALLMLLSPLAAELSWAQSPPKTTAAILRLDAKGLSEDEGATLNDRLHHEMVRTAAFEVMERGRMQEILKEQGFQQSGACNTDKCAVEIGELIGVQKVVAGSVGKIGRTYTVNVRLIDVRTGRVDQSVVEDYTGEIDKLLTEVLKKVADKLALAVRGPVVISATAKQGGSIFTRWWFWGGLGTAVAGGVAALLGKKKDAATPPTTPETDKQLDTPPVHPQ